MLLFRLTAGQKIFYSRKEKEDRVLGIKFIQQNANRDKIKTQKTGKTFGDIFITRFFVIIRL